MSAANLVGRLHDALGLDVDPASEQRYTASLSASVASSHSSPALVESLAGRLQNPKDGFESPEAFAAARARVEASRGKAFTDSFVSLLAKLKQDNALSALCREQRADVTASPARGFGGVGQYSSPAGASHLGVGGGGVGGVGGRGDGGRGGGMATPPDASQQGRGGGGGGKRPPHMRSYGNMGVGIDPKIMSPASQSMIKSITGSSSTLGSSLGRRALAGRGKGGLGGASASGDSETKYGGGGGGGGGGVGGAGRSKLGGGGGGLGSAALASDIGRSLDALQLGRGAGGAHASASSGAADSVAPGSLSPVRLLHPLAHTLPPASTTRNLSST